MCHFKHVIFFHFVRAILENHLSPWPSFGQDHNIFVGAWDFGILRILVDWQGGETNPFLECPQNQAFYEILKVSFSPLLLLK
jgi:hypothetical protein